MSQKEIPKTLYIISMCSDIQDWYLITVWYIYICAEYYECVPRSSDGNPELDEQNLLIFLNIFFKQVASLSLMTFHFEQTLSNYISTNK